MDPAQYLEACEKGIQKILGKNGDLTREDNIAHHCFRYAHTFRKDSTNVVQDYKRCLKSLEALKALGVLETEYTSERESIVAPFEVDDVGIPLLSDLFARYNVG